MQRKQEFICKTLDEGMELAVAYFHLSEEKIFLNILEEDETQEISFTLTYYKNSNKYTYK